MLTLNLNILIMVDNKTCYDMFMMVILSWLTASCHSKDTETCIKSDKTDSMILDVINSHELS